MSGDCPQPFAYDIEVRGDHLVVRQRGLLTVDVALQFQKVVEDEMAKAGVRLVIFDNRQTDRPEEMVRAVMWTWLGSTTCLDRLALVLVKERNTRRANEAADRNRVRVAAFFDEQDAVDWLRS